MAHFKLFSLILFLLSSLSVVTTLLLLQVRKSFIATTTHPSSSFPMAHHVDEKKYSFIHDDFPNTPIFETENVVMNVEDSMHYQMHGAEAIQEWDALEVVGLGSVTLGTNYRTFYLPMFHQSHCLRTFLKALDNGESNYQGSQAHINHCFNYFRQWTMCNADLTLEPGDFMARNFTRERKGMAHVCRAWDRVYFQAAMKWVEWAKYWTGSKMSEKNRTSQVINRDIWFI